MLLGLSINEPEKWKEFLEIAESSFQSQFGPFQVEAFKMFGYDVVGNENKFLRSEYLNIYGYPEELDYNDVVPQPPKHFRIDAFIRCESEPFELPEEFKKKIQPNDKLIYVSMGSMGSIGSPITSASYMNSGIWAHPMSSDNQMSFSSLNVPHEYPSPYSSDSFAPDTLLGDHQPSSGE